MEITNSTRREIDLAYQKLAAYNQNRNERQELTKVTSHGWVKLDKLAFGYKIWKKKFARYFGLQDKPSSGAKAKLNYIKKLLKIKV